MSEALLFAEHGENMLCTKIVLNARNNFCTQHVLPRFELGIFMYWTCNSMNNLLPYCGLVDAKIRASDKDLPVHYYFFKVNKLRHSSERSLSSLFEFCRSMLTTFAVGYYSNPSFCYFFSTANFELCVFLISWCHVQKITLFFWRYFT